MGAPDIGFWYLYFIVSIYERKMWFWGGFIRLDHGGLKPHQEEQNFIRGRGV
jgi:hypothetical protein